MKKSISLIIALAAIILSIIIPTQNVYAANKKITTLDVTQINGKVSVSGTAEQGTLAVAIAVYDKKGESLITMKTTAVDSDNGYTDELSLNEGEYLIKVADYEGGAFIEKTISITTEENNNENKENEVVEEKKDNPRTGDDIAVYTTLLIASTMGMMALILEKARKK